MILDRLFEKRATWTHAGHPKDPVIADILGVGRDTSAGITVTEDTALCYSAVYACVRIISETVAMLPVFVYETLSDTERQVARKHPVFGLVHDVPNEEQTSMVFHEENQATLLLWGWSYAEIERAKSGRPLALWPIHPRRVNRFRRENGELAYQVYEDSDSYRPKAAIIDAADMLATPGPCGGKSIIRWARESIGVGLAAEQYGGSFFGNGAVPSGVIEMEGQIRTDEAKKRFKENWEATHGGRKRGVAILEQGAKYKSIGIPPDDAQFLETRKHQVIEIARWFRVPPHKLADLDRATFSNIEEQNRDFIQDSILPWLVRWQKEYNRKLFGVAERERYTTEHVVEMLLKADILKRYQAYATGRQWGWMSVNDIRRLENWNSIGEEGDVYLTPGNMIDSSRLDEIDLSPPAQQKAPPKGEDNKNKRNDPVAAAKATFERILQQMIVKESRDARDAAKQPGRFIKWLDSYYPKFEKRMLCNLRPAVETLAAVGEIIDLERMVAEHCERSKNRLLEITGQATAKELAQKVDIEVTLWSTEHGKARLAA